MKSLLLITTTNKIYRYFSPTKTANDPVDHYPNTNLHTQNGKERESIGTRQCQPVSDSAPNSDKSLAKLNSKRESLDFFSEYIAFIFGSIYLLSLFFLFSYVVERGDTRRRSLWLVRTVN